MSEDITLDEYNNKPIMLKVFGKDRLIDLRSINRWHIYQKKEGNNYTLYSILLESGICYKYRSVMKRGENEPTYTEKHELTVYIKLYNYSDSIPLKIDLKPFASKSEREGCKDFYRDDSNKGMSWFEGIPQ